MTVPAPDTEPVFGCQLNVGDVVLVWWQPGRDTVLSLQPYRGSHEGDQAWEGVRTAEFALIKTGMTIFPGEPFDRFNP